MFRQSLSLAPLALILAGCGRSQASSLPIQTATVERRTIVVQAEATGIIEPINVVEVKSRSSGQIIEMPIETGSLVRPGMLIVQLDTRDVKNQFDQAKADLEASEKQLEVAEVQKRRSDELLAAKIITPQENEATQLSYANALSSIVRARTNLDLAQQRLDDARVTAPVTGTIIDKPVALGQVIQSGTSTAGGGTTIVKMADLTKVRARALVNETDIGRVQQGQAATVIVDAFPDRPFAGIVEKIEPQAVVQQNVTMFPVLVSLENREGLLMPGMNGEVSIISDRRENVVAVPNEAIRSVREAAQAAEILGIDPDSVQAHLRRGMAPAGGIGGGMPAGGPAGRPRQIPVSSPGFVAFSEPVGQQGRPGQGGFQLPNVTDAQCKGVEDARLAKPAAAKKVDDLTARMRDPSADRQALTGQLRAAYTELGVDINVVRACRARAGTGPAGQSATPATAGNPTGTPATNPAGNPAGAPRQTAAGTPATPTRASRTATRAGLVFVQRADSSWEARMVRLGVADYDFTEVISGLEEGDRVALLSAAALQMQRQQNQDRMRAMTGGASPLGGATGGARPGPR
ncbi:MAG: efflux RND transporter periplasmic adaptor subunit [Gemmatimonadaceae bacterium]